MKKKVLFLMISSILSVSLFVSCGDNSSNDKDSNTNIENNENNNADDEIDTEDKVENEDENENESEDSGNSNIDKDFATIEKESGDILESIFTSIYNKDYSTEDKNSILTSIKDNFTESGYENISNKITNYTNEILVSDFIITLFKETDNINTSEYKATYNIRYNVTVTSGKPSILADIIATVVVDNNNNILIESINNNEF